MYLTKSDKATIAKLISELTELATYKDIDASVMLMDALKDRCGIKATDIPNYDVLKGL